MSNSELYIGKTTKHAGQDFVWNGTKWVLFDQRKGPGVITIIGPEGPDGPAGAPGAPGAKGDPGEKGDAGLPGAAGQPGADGAPGAKGDPGDKGDAGLPGAAGQPGADGAKGDKGDSGEQGRQGIQGLPGLPGAKGDNGDPGEQGRQGIQGLPGADGVDGQDGVDGAPGAPGQGVPTGGSTGQILAKTGSGDYATAWVNAPAGGGSTPSWQGQAHAAYSDGNTQALLERIYTEAPVVVTATHVTTSVIRLIRFYNPANLTVNCLRALASTPFTAGGALFKFALYNAALNKITDDIGMTSVAASANAWYQVGSALNISLQAGNLYYLAITVSGTNNAAPLRCFGANNALNYNFATPAELGNSRGMTFHSCNTTSGTLPSTITSFRAAERNLEGGFPAIFLCNS